MEAIIKRIEVHEVKNVLVEYSDHLDENGHVSVTAWANGEGFDVEVHGGGGDHGSSGMIGLTHTQWEALQRAMNRLQCHAEGEGSIPSSRSDIMGW